jgi:hypothetical protein
VIHSRLQATAFPTQPTEFFTSFFKLADAKKYWPAQLLALDQGVAAKIGYGESGVAPGVAQDYPEAKKR